ncbi:MAG: disulfide bond formation protein B [Pseudomonadota bacterium]
MRLSPDFARVLNFLGLMGMIGVLIGAYYMQFAYRELPCTLCLLQRLAMVAVAYGAAMNVVLGPDPRHYGVCLVSAVFGGAIAIRQSLLHINPYFDKTTSMPTLEATANPGFGSPIFGYHMYIWGVLIFGSVILIVGLVQLFKGQFEKAEPSSNSLRTMAMVGAGLFFAVAAVETVTVFLECGPGDCPNDGGWNWWILRQG